MKFMDNNFSSFDGGCMTLGHPVRLYNGIYHSKIEYNGNDLVIQLPESVLQKNVEQENMKFNGVFNFHKGDATNNYIKFVDILESHIRTMIFDKRNIWFQEPLSSEDISYFFNDSIKKSTKEDGTNNYTQRIEIARSSSIFNEDDKKLTINEMKKDKNVICLVKVKGLKFSPQSFNIDFQVQEVLIMNAIQQQSNITIPSVIEMKREDKEHLEVNVEEETKTEPETEDVLDINNDVDETLTNLQTDNEPEYSVGTVVSDNEEDSSLGKDDVTEVNIVHAIEDKKPDNDDVETNNNDTVEEQDQEELITNEEDDVEDTENKDELEEYTIAIDDLPKNDDAEDNSIQIMKPNEVYYQIYREAKRKAKLAKQAAIMAYLELQNIKNRHMIVDNGSIDDSDDEGYDTDDEMFNGMVEQELI